MIEIEKTGLEGVLLIKPYVFEDFRGEYISLYNSEIYKKNGINIDFFEDDISMSTKNILRGIHGNFDTWKLVSCLFGKFYLVVADCNEKSPNYRKWISFTLSDRNRYQVLIPPGFGNGHLVMSDKVIFHYKQSSGYDPSTQFTIKWNDPKFNIWWPIKNPIVSRRDEEGHYV